MVIRSLVYELYLFNSHLFEKVIHLIIGMKIAFIPHYLVYLKTNKRGVYEYTYVHKQYPYKN